MISLLMSNMSRVRELSNVDLPFRMFIFLVCVSFIHEMNEMFLTYIWCGFSHSCFLCWCAMVVPHQQLVVEL